MKDLSKLIQDQELIIQALIMRGDDDSKYVARKAMDVCTVLILEEMGRRKSEKAQKNN